MYGDSSFYDKLEFIIELLSKMLNLLDLYS